MIHKLYALCALVFIFALAPVALLAQAETQNPTFPFWKVKGNSGTNSGSNFIGTIDNVSLRVRTNNTERMVIDSNGAVGIGIGTTNLSYGYAKLEIASEGAGVNSDILVRNAANFGSWAPGLSFQRSRGTLAAPAAVINGDFLAAMESYNYDGANYVRTAGINIWADSVVSVGSVPARLDIFSSGGGISLNRFGNLGIATGNPLQKLHINGTGSSMRVGGLATGGSFIKPTTAATDKLVYADANGDVKAIANGTSGQTLSINGSGVPAWATASATAWNLTGNSGTNSGSNFIGTTDNVSLRLRTNNTERMVIDSTGNVGIGVANATAARLVVNGNLSVGSNTNAVGVYSAAVGQFDTIAGVNNIVGGAFNNINGHHNLVGGHHNFIAYDQSIVVGNYDSCIGSSSVVFGYGNKAEGFTSFVTGDHNIVLAQGGVAFGFHNLVLGGGGIAMGSSDTASGTYSTVFGESNRAASYGEFVAGMYSTNYAGAGASSFNLTDRIFNIGNGTGGGSRSDAFTVLKNGNVGIGVASPNAAKLVVLGNLSVGNNTNVVGLYAAAVGQSNTVAGNSFASGSTNYVPGTSSVAMGFNDTVSGNYSAAFGRNNKALGTSSLVAGSYNYAGGNGSVVFGDHDTATNAYSFISGYNNKTTQCASAIVGGHDNDVTGAFSVIAGGHNNTVTGNNSFAAGSSNFCIDVSIVAGSSDTADGYASASFNRGNRAAGSHSMAIGSFNTAPSFGEFAIGNYGTVYTAVSAGGPSATDRVFNVGNGGSPGARADAFTILKGGNVGIANNNPTAKLDVNGTLKATAWAQQSIAANGYAILGGLKVQWGTGAYNSSGAIVITFPIAFTTLLSVTATVDAGANTGSGANIPCKVMNSSATAFQYAGTQLFAGDLVSQVRWMAIGN